MWGIRTHNIQFPPASSLQHRWIFRNTQNSNIQLKETSQQETSVNLCSQWVACAPVLQWPIKIVLFYKKEIMRQYGSTSEKAMAPHSSTLAWKIPWIEEPGRLQSMGSLRVGHNWATSLSLFTFHFHALEKEMATHSSVLAWRIPGTGEPGGLPSMGSHRVGYDWSNLAAAAAYLTSEKAMAPHSNTLAWKIPWTEDPGGP